MQKELILAVLAVLALGACERHLNTSKAVAPTRAPLMGEHTETVLQSLAGFSADEVRALREKRVI